MPGYTDPEATDMPVGAIVLWSGSISSLPSNWTLCDGTDGAPDLRDRFVVGAGNSYAVDDTGGAESVTLTESEMPSHTHSVGNTVVDAGIDGDIADKYTDEGATTGSTTSSTTGGDNAHENRPPFYSLAYIMKVN